jgi:hypothetical protein
MPNPLKTPRRSSPTLSVTGVTTTLTTPFTTSPGPTPDALAKLLRLAEALGRQAAQRAAADGRVLAPLLVRDAAR